MGIWGKIGKLVYRESKAMVKDIVKTVYLPRDIGRGYKQGVRLSRMNKSNSIFGGVKNRSIGVVRKGLAPHLGGIFGVLTYPLPVPSALFYFAGKKAGYKLTKVLRQY